MKNGCEMKVKKQEKTYRLKKSTTYDLIVTALLIALVFIATKFINIKLPIGSQGGLIHFGNVMIYIATLVFGTRKGAIAGSVGMALFDILSGWVIWAPCRMEYYSYSS